MSRNIQLFDLPFLYMQGLGIGWVSNNEIAIGFGQCRDSSDSIDIVIGGRRYGELAATSAIALNATRKGAAGIDIGALAASTWYGVWVIADSSNKLPPSAILSLASNTAPALPFGYDSYRLRNYVLTDASSHIIPFYTHGTGSTVTNFWTNDITVLTAGAATSYTAINMSGAIPPVAQSIVTLSALYTPAVAGNQFYIRPTGANATITTATTTGSGVVAAKIQAMEVSCLAYYVTADSACEVDYKVVSSDALTLLVSSYQFNV
jgi:hypothetical protein